MLTGPKRSALRKGSKLFVGACWAGVYGRLSVATFNRLRGGRNKRAVYHRPVVKHRPGRARRPIPTGKTFFFATEAPGWFCALGYALAANFESTNTCAFAVTWCHNLVLNRLFIFYAPLRNQIGRVKASAAILRHLERLAVYHIPRDAAADMDSSVRQAVRDGKMIKKRMAQAQCSTHDEGPTLPARADQQHIFKVDGGNVPDDQHSSPTEPSPVRTVRMPHDGQEALAVAPRIPTPNVSICVDISWNTFCVFVDLIKGIRDKKYPATDTTANKPTDDQTVDSSEALKNNCIDQYPNLLDDIGPESSSCAEQSPDGYAGAEPYVNQSTGTAAASVDRYSAASQLVQMEALRCTLKLLKVNLFHFVRSAAVCRACRGNDHDHRNTLPNFQTWRKHAARAGGFPADCDGEGTHVHGQCDLKETPGDEHKGIGRAVDTPGKGQLPGSRFVHDLDSVNNDNEEASPGTQRAILESLGENEHDVECGRAKDTRAVIEELRATLQTLVEDTNANGSPEMTKAAKAVQVSCLLSGIALQQFVHVFSRRRARRVHVAKPGEEPAMASRPQTLRIKCCIREHQYSMTSQCMITITTELHA